MEHRWNPRKEINSPVMVYQERIGFIKATVKNISADGILVEVGNYALTKGAVVTLAGTAFRKLQNEILRLRALIVHANDSVAGLMFVGDGHHVAALRQELEGNYGKEPCFPAGDMIGTFETGHPAHAVAYGSQ